MPSARPNVNGQFARERSRLGFRSRKGLTLVETMMATMVFTMGMLGVYMMLVKSYQLVTLCRHRDNARAILLSYGDKFQRLKTTDAADNLNFLFQTATTPTGFGLEWTDSNNHTVSNYTTITDTDGLEVMLGDPASSGVVAHLKRQVQPIQTSDGTPIGAPVYTAAGYMLQGTFSISYEIKGRTLTQSITVARSFR